MNGTTSSSDRVYLGASTYYRDNGSKWAKRARLDQDIRPLTILFTNRAFTNKGLEAKADKQLHRIEITDTASFDSEYETAQGVSNANLTLVFWTDDQGIPVAYNLSGTFVMVVKGLSENFEINEDWSIVKTSGVTISAPI
jgi:hypothetical protein